MLGSWTHACAGVERCPDTQTAVALHAAHPGWRHHEGSALLSVRGESPHSNDVVFLSLCLSLSHEESLQGALTQSLSGNER